MSNTIKIKSEMKEEAMCLQSLKKDDRVKDSPLTSTNEDVQRAIEGLKEIPDEELQEFLNDEFMEGLDVVDAWEGDEEKNKDGEETSSSLKQQDQKRVSRERHRRDGKGSHNRERPKRDEKKREEMRRDPNKSSKDIERDKMRTKRDNESKLLAEKEKAIKNLLDSDNVVPPGTEAEAIQSIAEKSLERAQLRTRRSRERRKSFDRPKSPIRRRSPDRVRVFSPRRRSPLLFSPERRKSPFKANIEKHRSPYRPSPKRRTPLRPYIYEHRSPPVPSPDRRRSSPRRPSWDRKTSADRRRSAERHRRRTDLNERRRSRSRERHRSRSVERLRRRGSRSPIGRRFSPRRWTRSRSRSRSRTPSRRTRKRSPFINELARQLRNEAINTSPGRQYGAVSKVDGIPPLLNQPSAYQPEAPTRPSVPTPYIHQPNVGPSMPPPPPVNGVQPFMNFEMPPQPINFEPVPSLHTMTATTYACGPVMYGQQNDSVGPSQDPARRPPLLPAPIQPPQPVPAPPSMELLQHSYNTTYSGPLPRRSPNCSFEPSNKSISSERSSSQSYRNGYHESKQERLKTPEPPVISDTKQFEKTSLSSLLEASVSGKDSIRAPVLYPGFKPEIRRHCEHALRELPSEDPRLKMEGRFFYEAKNNVEEDKQEHVSNSLLLQKNKSKIYWEEEEEKHITLSKQAVQTHQKICQTDEVDTDTKFVQASVVMVDFQAQVYPHDLQQVKEEKRPIMDRLDWSARETFDYTTDYREAGDLRWSLSNSSQKKWRRSQSPPRRSVSQEHRLNPISSEQHIPRTSKESPIRSRNHFPNPKAQHREHYARERYSPDYRQGIDDREEFTESRSDHSRGGSPMMLEESDEEFEVDRTFQRRPDWSPRGKPPRGRANTYVKNHTVRGRYNGGRPYRGRSSFHAKY